MTTYPLPTLAATVSSTGISAPSYADILASLQASYRAIYGADAYLDADSQDGQLLAIFASAINDSNQMAISVYNAFSPASAQGAGLSSVVKINGLQRLASSRSTAVVTLVGQEGTVINSGVVGDNLTLGTKWALPATVTIPNTGTIDVTATCTADGATAAAIGSLTNILTPTRGWQSVTNAAPADAGNPVETDATLRQRQAQSVALPAQSVLEAMGAAIANVAGVSRHEVYENDTGAADINGIPAHSISAVVEGGDVQTIAGVIAAKKTPGTGTYGTTSEVVVDPAGVPNTIRFYVLAVVQLDIVITIKALAGWISTTIDPIKAAVAADRSALDIGEDSYLSKIYSAANLDGNPLARTYYVTSIAQCRHGGTPVAADVAINFNEAAAAVVGNITVNVT